MTDVVEGRISVVIPVFDMGRYLPEAVASIDAQRHDDIEIIVVDDGSADDTPEVIASLGDRVIALRQENQGPSAARNAGLGAPPATSSPSATPTISGPKASSPRSSHGSRPSPISTRCSGASSTSHSTVARCPTSSTKTWRSRH